LTITFTGGGAAEPSSGSDSVAAAGPSNWPVLCLVQILCEDVNHLPAQVIGKPHACPFSAEEVLVAAERVLELHGEKYRQSALERFHLIFESDAEIALELEGLRGMASIKSHPSLPVFKRCWKSHYSIFNNYAPVDPTVLGASVLAFFEVVSGFDAADKHRAGGLVDSLRLLLSDLEDAALWREILERLSYIVKWRVLAPIPWDVGCSSVHEVYLQSRAVDPDLPFEIAGEKLNWQDFESARPMDELQAVLGPLDRVSAYLSVEITLDEPCRLPILAGSDDGFKSWFDGDDADGFDAPRGYSADQTILHADGRKGHNRLLFRVIEQGESWAFSARVVEDQDRKR